MAKSTTKAKAASRKVVSPKPKAGKTSPIKNASGAVRGRSRPAAKTPTTGIPPRTKTEACLALLARPEGASLEELQQLTGWQAHSVRGFLAGTVKKIPGASLVSDKQADRRRYYLRRA